MGAVQSRRTGCCGGKRSGGDRRVVKVCCGLGASDQLDARHGFGLAHAFFLASARIISPRTPWPMALRQTALSHVASPDAPLFQFQPSLLLLFCRSALENAGRLLLGMSWLGGPLVPVEHPSAHSCGPATHREATQPYLHQSIDHAAALPYFLGPRHKVCSSVP